MRKGPTARAAWDELTRLGIFWWPLIPGRALGSGLQIPGPIADFGGFPLRNGSDPGDWVLDRERFSEVSTGEGGAEGKRGGLAKLVA